MPKIIDHEYRLVDVGELQQHPDNPRRGDVGAIAESIEHNGFFGAVLVQRSTGYVLAGNHRLEAARREGLRKLPALLVDVDDDRALRILLADNRTNDVAGYDDQALADLLTEVAASQKALLGTAWSDDALAQLLEMNAAPQMGSLTDLAGIGEKDSDSITIVVEKGRGEEFRERLKAIADRNPDRGNTPVPLSWAIDQALTAVERDLKVTA